MPELDALTVLYTAGIGGQLERLPALYAFMQQLRLGRGASVLLDLGDQCAPDIWHCAATEERSTLIVLDGMGYHAAHTTSLPERSRQQLVGVCTMALVDEQHQWRYDVPPLRDEGIIVSSLPSPSFTLNIVLTPTDQTLLEGNTLFLGRLAPFVVGVVTVQLVSMQVSASEQHPLPADVRPDPTILAAIDFVLAEARYVQSRRASS